MNSKNKITDNQKAELIKILQLRFENNLNRHKNIPWKEVLTKLQNNPLKLYSLFEMEKTGGEPDVVDIKKDSIEITFIDCSPESPLARRSLCYDQQALNSRNENKPKASAIQMAESIGVELLSGEQYLELQKFGNFDTKTSSWLKTPASIRALGGAIFGDKRYNTVFIYHNGADSYYSSRGFRGFLLV